MNALPFVKISVGSLGLRVPAEGSTQAVELPPCVCEIRLHNFPVHTAPVPLVSCDPDPRSTAASFYLDEPALRRLLTFACFGSSSPFLEIAVFLCGAGSLLRNQSRKAAVGELKDSGGPRVGRREGGSGSPWMDKNWEKKQQRRERQQQKKCGAALGSESGT